MGAMYTDSSEAVQNNFVFICDHKAVLARPLQPVFARAPQHAGGAVRTRLAEAAGQASDDAVDEGGEL